MPNKREGYTRLNFDIPTEWHDTIKRYNKNAKLQVSMTNIVRCAIKECVDKIENQERGV